MIVGLGRELRGQAETGLALQSFIANARAFI